MKLQFSNTYPGIGMGKPETHTVTIERDRWDFGQDEMIELMRQLWHSQFNDVPFPLDPE